MKANVYIILLTIAALFAFTGCRLDYPPENTLVDELVYKSEKTARAAVMGAYCRLNVALSGAPNDQNNYANTGYAYLLGDIGTDNVKVQETSSDFLAAESAEYKTDQHNGYIRSVYLYLYNAIDFANNVIAGIQQFGQYEARSMARHVAEARFIRAYSYMTLLQYYGDGALVGDAGGLGLVIEREPYSGYNPDAVKPRSTVADVYDLILSDLQSAVRDLPLEVPAASERYRATRTTVWALLSRVYLYRGSYTSDARDMEQASSYADSVLAHYTFPQAYNEHRLNLFPDNMYTDGMYPNPTHYSEEVIFFEPSRQQGSGYGCGVTGWYRKVNYCVNPAFARSYRHGDLRGWVRGNAYSMMAYGDLTSNPKDTTTLKFDNGGGFTDVIYIRLAEIKLTRAEAQTRAGGRITEEALTHLNDIRCRPYVPGTAPAALRIGDFPSVSAFLDTVLTERNRELAFEGHARWDLIRTGRDLKTKGLPNNRKILPIPEYEVRISDGVIQQNTGFRN